MNHLKKNVTKSYKEEIVKREVRLIDFLLEEKPVDDNSLVEIRGDQAVTTSLDIAKAFCRKHRTVLKAIHHFVTREKPLEYATFEEASYVDPNNKQKFPMYYLNRNAFEYVVLRIGDKSFGPAFEKYLNAFGKANNLLQRRKTVFGTEDFCCPI